MLNSGIRNLTGNESGILTYDQLGFDYIQKDHNTTATKDCDRYFATSGTDLSNVFYKDIPYNGLASSAHWIGIHNCGTLAGETVQIQARSLVGDDLARTGTYDSDTNLAFLEIIPGDIVYGQFVEVAILRTNGSPYVDRLRLIRGV